AATGKEQRRLPVVSSADARALSADGRTIVFVDAGHVRVLDVATGKELHKFKAAGLANAGLALSPDGRVLAAKSRNGSVRLLDIARGRDLRRPWQAPDGGGVPVVIGGSSPRRVLMDLAWSPDGRALAFTAEEGSKGGGPVSVQLWDLAAGKVVCKFPEQ